jgi:hypothetical protein
MHEGGKKQIQKFSYNILREQTTQKIHPQNNVKIFLRKMSVRVWTGFSWLR